jgi:hypothetical protein
VTDAVLNQALTFAAGFFALGLLVLFFAAVLLGLVDFVKRVLG